MNSSLTGHLSAQRVLEIWSICLRTIDLSYSLTIAELSLLAGVCKVFRASVSSHQYCRRWLRRYESGRGSLWSRFAPLFREYHAARVLRCFLHGLGSFNPPVVISGSFATAMFLESTVGCSWRPKDIDVWTCSSSQVALISDMFVENVLRPLGLKEQYCTTETDATFSEFPDSAGMQRACTDHETLLPKLKSWLRGDENCLCNRNIDVSLLEAVIDHLPHRFESRALPVTSTSTIALQREAKFVPACMMPLNIIVVDIGNPCDLAKEVCSGFDITACCIELAVADGQQYEFRFHHGAKEAALRGVLKLTPNAFWSSSPNLQMLRVAKYLERGFSW